MIIFYADDDEEDQEIFSMVIHGLDPKVKLITARDGKDAIAVLSNATDAFDAIFLDLNMPLVNGLE
jgi:CheY-like chemotaxis protein